MPDSQKYVKEKLQGKPEGKHLEITDVPRDWKSRSGATGTGQFLKVEKDGKIAVVIASEKKLFDFEEFSEPDQDYIRSFLARAGKPNLVPAKSSDPDRPTNGGSTNAVPGSSLPFTTPGFPGSSEPGSSTVPGVPAPAVPGFSSSGPTFPSSPGPSSSGLPSSVGSGGSVTPSPAPSSTDFASTGNSPRHLSGAELMNRAMQNPADSQASNSSSPPRNPFLDALHQDVYECSSCGKEVSRTSTSCPHCKRPFDYVEDEFGNKTEINGNSSTRIGQGIIGILKLGMFAVAIGAGIRKLFSKRS